MNRIAATLALAACFVSLAQGAETSRTSVVPLRLPPLSTAPLVPPATVQNTPPPCTPELRARGLCGAAKAPNPQATPALHALPENSPINLSPVPDHAVNAPTANNIPGVSPGGDTSFGGAGSSIPPPNLTPLSAPTMLAVPLLTESRPKYESNQIILYWPDKQNAVRDLARLQSEFGLSPRDKAELNNLGGVLVTLYPDPQTDLVKLRNRLRETFSQAAIDFNSRYYAEAGPRQYFTEQMNIASADDGPAVPLGIVDGEVRVIPALSQAHIMTQSFLTPSESAGAGAHATAVATLMVGQDDRNKFRGIAIRAHLFNAGIMRQQGQHASTNSLLLARALDWMLSRQVKVINLSLGGAGDAAMSQIFVKLRILPVAIVAAAGNSGPSAPPSYPAAYPGVIAVTATNAAQEIYAYANQGSYIAFAAPGEDLWVPNANDGQYVSGTSYASALAAAVIARLLAQRQTLDAAHIRKLLCDNARDLGVTGTDPVFGCGLLQFTGILNKQAGSSVNSQHR